MGEEVVQKQSGRGYHCLYSVTCLRMRQVVIQYGVFLLGCIRAASADIRQRVRAGLKLSGGFFQGDLRVREAASQDEPVWQERGSRRNC